MAEIVLPYARLMDVPSYGFGVELLKRIEWAGRISHRSEEAQSETSWERFIRSVVLGHGDWSITEHASVMVDAVVDRGITHEWRTHRIASYTQESTRFVNYVKRDGLGFVKPSGMSDKQVAYWLHAIEGCEVGYEGMIAEGCKPQLARSVLPHGLAARIITSANLRNWRHFLLMRTTKESHPQMREVTVPLLKEFQEKIPLLFEDIEPEARQADNLKKPR